MASPPVTLLALATAVPPNQLEQSAVADFARRIYAESFSRYPKLADVFVNAGIERRYSVRPLEWFDAPHDWTERTQAYLEGASALFVQAAKAALDRAGVSARDVDVIVTVSSTGIATPSLEARVGAVGVEEQLVLKNEKEHIALPVRPIERIKHRIHFTGNGVIPRCPKGVTLRAGELPRPFLAMLAIASSTVGRSQ
jgi:Predicted naringenin-chalcone synthase